MFEKALVGSRQILDLVVCLFCRHLRSAFLLICGSWTRDWESQG